MMKAIGYIRLSDRGAKGGEISLQRQAEQIEQFCKLNNLELINTFSDVGKSGRKLQRDGLNKAIVECSLRGATLVAFSLDRIARDVKVLERLKTEKIAFRALDIVDVSEMNLDLIMFMAKMYSQLCSSKMKRYHSHRKELVVKGLATPHPLPTARPDLEQCRKNAAKARQTHKENSDKRKSYAWQKIEELYKSSKSTREIAKILNQEGFQSARGKDWNHVAIYRIIREMDA